MTHLAVGAADILPPRPITQQESSASRRVVEGGTPSPVVMLQ
jgi:hypothetical protein